MATAANPLLFVNKDATNWKGRSKAEAFEVASHVSKSYTRWSKVARLQGTTGMRPQAHQQNHTPRSDSTHGINDGQALDVSTTWSTPRALSESTQKSYQPSSWAAASPSVINDAVSAEITAAPTYDFQRLSMNWAPSAMTVLRSGNSDPFDTSLLKITPQNSYAIATWSSIYMHVVFPEPVGYVSRRAAEATWRHNCERMVGLP